MKSVHATEEQIQAYVDGIIGEDFALLSEHIENCEQCRETMHQYRALFGELADDTGFELPAGFARTVAAQVEVGKDGAVAPERWSPAVLFAILGPALMAAITFYILGYESLLSGLGDFGQTMLGNIDAMFTGCATYLQRLGLRPDLFLFTMLVLLVISGLDRLLRTLRHGKAMLLA